MNLQGPLLYIIIFFAKIIEVSFSTIRLVYINKGERLRVQYWFCGDNDLACGGKLCFKQYYRRPHKGIYLCSSILIR